MRRAARASVCTAIVLCAIKGVAVAWTGSLALVGALVDSGLDLLASLVSLVAIETAIQPADKEHRFGHGKAEGVAGLMQAVAVTLAALVLAGKAALALHDPDHVANEEFGIVAIILSMAITFCLLRYQRYVVAQTQSLAVKSDSLHYASDFAMNGAVLVALIASAWLDWPLADPICGLAVAIWVMHSAWQIGSDALDMLLDREAEDEVRERVEAIVLAHTEVKGIHDLRTRRSGRALLLQFHMELDAQMPLGQAHVISDEVEGELLTAFAPAEVLIHLDPDDLEPDHLALH